MKTTLLLSLVAVAAGSPPPVSRASSSASASASPTPSEGAFKLTYTAYHNSSSCKGASVTRVIPEGGCVNLPVPAMSWRSSPANAAMEMLVYPGTGCTGEGSVEHLDADESSCFTPKSLFVGGPMAKSLCVGCPF